ncbi:DUF6886 family protein [Phenylobacterium koreense]|uniref:Uncharacterized protein n=2 Tax=Phenylobacterium TaxID=20 RepID=A0ABV2EJY4_9CAUL
MRLFHFSDDPGIERFEPRPVRVPSARPPGRDWLNGPLVWAIDDWHAPMYLFPRDCPRILIWPLATSSAADVQHWWGGRDCRMIAHVEWAWFEALKSSVLHRYELPRQAFESLDDAGMWVARQGVTPIARETLTDLPEALRQSGVELRLMDDLTPLKGVWSSSLHASGIRLRNALNWAA